MERRMVLRLLTHWWDWCGDADYPYFAKVDLARMAEIWDFSFALDIVGREDNPVVRTVGSEFQKYLPQAVRDCALSDVPAGSLIEHTASYYHAIIDRGLPISRGEFIKYDGMKVLYRSIILPMSDDGTSVSGLFGTANYREVPNG
jgi:hypothetical protein